MKILKKIRSNNILPILLFFIILINYIPLFIINYDVKTSNAVKVKEMTICFAIECILLILFLFKKIKFNKEFKVQFGLLAVSTLCMFLVQTKNYYSGNYEIMDFANIICIAINIFFLYICLLDIRIDEKKVYIFFRGIICLGIIACIYNIILYNKEILTLLGIGKDAFFNSVKSFFAHRNQFAIFLYICIISNVFMLFKSNKKAVYILTLLLFLINLVFTASRTGLLCTGIFIFLLLVTTNKISKKNKIKLFIILILLGIAGLTIIYNFMPKVLQTIEKVFIRKSTIKNFTGRSTIWSVGISLITQNIITFIFGVGRFIGIKALDLTPYASVTQFHSFYVDMLVTGGIMELIYLLFIYFTIIKKVINSNIDTKYKRIYISVFISYAIYCLCESLGRFSIGCADTVCLIAFISIPLLHANSITEDKLIEKGKEK